VTLKFVKTEAAGNDLVLVDGRGRTLPALPPLARALCDRHFGVGGDGLLTLSDDGGAGPLVRMHNPDGTEDFCGNGMRCIAAWLCRSGEACDHVFMRTPIGRHRATVRDAGGGHYDVEVELLTPEFRPCDVPALLEGERILDRPFDVGGRALRISSVRVGSTHTVVFADADVPEREFLRLSPLIERHAAFPQRTSVLWCRAESRDRLRMRIWERGVGETFACGTGACAAVVIGRELGLTGDRAEVVTRGGSMSAEWAGQGPVRLTGPARIVYEGVWASR